MLTYAATLVVIWISVTSSNMVGGTLGDLLLLLVPVAFIWGPVWVLRKRGVDPDRYPLALPPLSAWKEWGRAFAIALGLGLVVAIPFVPLYDQWQMVWYPELLDGVCELSRTERWVRRIGGGNACRYASFEPSVQWTLPADFGLVVARHLFYVAIPEELFYRGYMQSRLDDVWPPKWTIFGAKLGPSWVLTSFLFAIGHSVVMFQWWHLAIMIPSFVFGWLRARTGDTLAGAFFHAGCNIFVVFLDTSYGLLPP